MKRRQKLQAKHSNLFIFFFLHFSLFEFFIFLSEINRKLCIQTGQRFSWLLIHFDPFISQFYSWNWLHAFFLFGSNWKNVHLVVWRRTFKWKLEHPKSHARNRSSHVKYKTTKFYFENPKDGNKRFEQMEGFIFIFSYYSFLFFFKDWYLIKAKCQSKRKTKNDKKWKKWKWFDLLINRQLNIVPFFCIIPRLFWEEDSTQRDIFIGFCMFWVFRFS